MSLRVLFVVLVLLVGCGGARAIQPEGPPTLSSWQVTLTGAEVQQALVWAWVPEEIHTAFQTGAFQDHHFADLLQNANVVPATRLQAEGTRFELSVPEQPSALLVASIPPGGDALGALLGEVGEAGFYALSEGLVEGPSFVQALTPGRAHEHPERCTGERQILHELEGPGRISDRPEARRICVMLPEGYAEAEARYPVIYLLPGYGGDHNVYRRLHPETRDAILVGVDGRSFFGTSYFYDHPASGAWMTHLENIVALVDAEYRTHPDADHRALLGHSTGGFNAIALSLRRPDLFHAAAASSPDALDMEHWLFENGEGRENWCAWQALEAGVGGAGQFVSYALSFDPDARIGAIEWPLDPESCTPTEAWDRWRMNSPIVLIDEPDVARALREELDGRLFISVGRNDAFGLFEPAERFHAQLETLGIAHHFEPTDGDHFTGSHERRLAGLRFLEALFSESTASEATGVE